MDERTALIETLKAALKENDGEVGYWGEKISMPDQASVNSVLTHSTIAALKTQSPSTSAAERLAALNSETIGDCQRCPLSQTRIKLVFGVGNPDAKVMFIGEGPGFDEDRQGEPFVGKAGQLLDKIMAAINLDRSKVYIANIVKCHPMVDPSQPEKRGNDRPPSPEEMDECLPFLREQIRIINPKIIVTLGATATKALLGSSAGITKLRGQVISKEIVPGLPPFPVLPTFHPAALLRDPELKKPVWEDMKKLRDLLANEAVAE